MMEDNKKRILLGQLASNGDCLFATTIARQIKSDYPNCHLTWAIGKRYASVLKNNLDVDTIWEIEEQDYYFEGWENFKKEVLKKKEEGLFDEVFFTQVYPENLHLYDGGIRSSLFNAYPNPITVSVQPSIRLDEKEVENVKNFALFNDLDKYKNVILFECAPQSFKSFVNVDYAIAVALMMVKSSQEVCFILSSNVKIPVTHKQIVDASTLSFRENAELTKYCTLLIGCSSGISWLSTTDWAKTLPTVQLINSEVVWFNSMMYDFDYFKQETGHIIEMKDCSISRLVSCITDIIKNGANEVKGVYHEKIPLNFNAFKVFHCYFLLTLNFKKSNSIYTRYIKRNGKQPILLFYLFYNYLKLLLLLPLLPLLVVKKSFALKISSI